MVGRWPSGAPLVEAPDADDPKRATANGFGYARHDADGMRCPIGVEGIIDKAPEVIAISVAAQLLQAVEANAPAQASPTF